MPLAEALAEAVEKIVECPSCGNLDTVSPCSLCQDPRRDRSMIVVVEEIGDLWALERAGVVNGLYHVLGGHLSPLDGIGPDRLNIARLIERAAGGEVQEIVLALNATVEGQSTAHYLTEHLAPAGVVVSRLAQGVPMGGELDYLDEGRWPRPSNPAAECSRATTIAGAGRTVGRPPDMRGKSVISGEIGARGPIQPFLFCYAPTGHG